ncbi:MAG: ABC transporter ATP-binding protein, partial [Gemmataceae bacterium]
MSEAGTEKPLIAIRGVRKTYRKGDVEVTPLEGVDLDIAAGEFFALMGPSGSGKSTLLNLVAGIDTPTAGRIVVGGEDITDWREDDLADWRTRAVGYIFQQFNLMPVLTAYENVELPLLLLPLTREKRRKLVATALELVGLSDRASHYPRQLSGGQEQRVAIARAIATDPKIVLADEPTGNLDRTSARGVMDLLSELNTRFGKTVLLVTHDPAVAARARRVLHLDK